jgi:hypothetical protein
MKNQHTPPPTPDYTISGVPETVQSPSTAEDQPDHRLRARSLLSQLTPEQTVQLSDWLQKHTVSDVLEMVAAPAPEGFGIRTHYNTLRRFKTQLGSGFISEELRETFEMCQDVADQEPSRELPNVQSILNAMLHQRAFDLLRRSASTDEINKVIDAITKMSSLDLKRQKLTREQQQSATPKHHRVDLNIVPLNRPSQVKSAEQILEDREIRQIEDTPK